MHGKVRIGAVAALAVACLVAAGAAAGRVRGTGSSRGAQAASAQACKLGNDAGRIKHVISIVFDNTHLFRDRPQFASDLELMPHLLDFLQGNGTLSDNEHTILISHTAGGILSSLTGLYPDRTGQAVTNSYRYFKADGTTASSTSFKYWNDLVDDANGTADPLPNMVNGDGGTPKTAPAPWVPYTRAGCDFGAVAAANVVLENTGTGKFGDMTTVFGSGSPEWNEAVASNGSPPGTKERALAQTDFVGLAVHCAKGGGICAGSPTAKIDSLPDEPGGYTGFQALFGAKYVNPAITKGQPVVNDIGGNPITDPFGQPGFPGFDGMSAAVTLGYVAQMQEAGIPVTFGYISDAHDNHHDPSGRNVAFGPGEAGYVQQLQQYDQAFAAFLDRLAADGITTENTLFVFTADEGDHFAGGDSPDGTWSHTNCNISGGQTCPANQIGEVNANLTALLPAGEPPFTVHSDSAPTLYVTGNPGRTDPALRRLERDVAAAEAIDPYLSPDPQPITLWLADPVAEKTLHMVTADPQRTPTFTLFALPDYFLSTFNCAPDAGGGPVCIDYHFAWSHGDATDDIGRTWLGLAGPGVRNLGRTSEIWSDHTDIRPTMLSLLGLTDTYAQDGRVLGEAITIGDQSKTLAQLGVVYKQVTAPFGAFAKDTLVVSTKALSSGSPTDDSTYTSLEDQIQSLTAERDGVSAQMRSALNAAAFGGTVPSDKELESLIAEGNDLLARMHALATG